MLLKLSALDLSRTKATRANVNGLVGSVDNCLDTADVCLPGSVGLTVRMGNVVSEDNALAADFTLCHFKFLLNITKDRSVRYVFYDKKVTTRYTIS